MKISTRIMSLILMVVMIFSMTGCKGGDISYAMEVNGEKVTPGVYMGYIVNAFMSAKDKVKTTTDFWNQTIDDKNVEQWIKDQAALQIKRDAGASQLAKEMNIALTDEEVANTKSTLEYSWKTSGEVYEKSGCSFNSALVIYTNNALANKVFQAIYGTGAPETPTQEELATAYNENYANVSVISLNYYDKDGNRISDDEIAKRDAHFTDMIARLEKGESYESLVREHGKWINETYGTDTFKEDEFVYTDSFSIVNKKDTSISNVLLDTIFGTEIGSAKTLKQDPTVYLVYREKLPMDEATVNTYKGTLILLLKEDSFNTKCDEAAKNITITSNEAAVNYYSPKNVSYSF